jgi:hypothetical protein
MKAVLVSQTMTYRLYMITKLKMVKIIVHLKWGTSGKTESYASFWLQLEIPN